MGDGQHCTPHYGHVVGDDFEQYHGFDSETAEDCLLYEQGFFVQLFRHRIPL